ncbi:hypothetical protein HDU76_001293, partial [Blyttiomyces sp. JEL0837]
MFITNTPLLDNSTTASPSAQNFSPLHNNNKSSPYNNNAYYPTPPTSTNSSNNNQFIDLGDVQDILDWSDATAAADFDIFNASPLPQYTATDFTFELEAGILAENLIDDVLSSESPKLEQEQVFGSGHPFNQYHDFSGGYSGAASPLLQPYVYQQQQQQPQPQPLQQQQQQQQQFIVSTPLLAIPITYETIQLPMLPTPINTPVGVQVQPQFQSPPIIPPPPIPLPLPVPQTQDEWIQSALQNIAHGTPVTLPPPPTTPIIPIVPPPTTPITPILQYQGHAHGSLASNVPIASAHANPNMPVSPCINGGGGLNAVQVPMTVPLSVPMVMQNVAVSTLHQSKSEKDLEQEIQNILMGGEQSCDDLLKGLLDGGDIASKEEGRDMESDDDEEMEDDNDDDESDCDCESETCMNGSSNSTVVTGATLSTASSTASLQSISTSTSPTTKQPRPPHGAPGPNPCPYPNCNKTYATPLRLKAHLRIHTRKRTHPCPYPNCTDLFFRKQDLERHEVTHKIEREVYCEGCGGGFTRRDALMRHLKMGRCRGVESVGDSKGKGKGVGKGRGRKVGWRRAAAASNNASGNGDASTGTVSSGDGTGS